MKRDPKKAYIELIQSKLNNEKCSNEMKEKYKKTLEKLDE